MPMIAQTQGRDDCDHCGVFPPMVYEIMPQTNGLVRLCRSCLKRLDEEIKTVLEEEP